MTDLDGLTVKYPGYSDFKFVDRPDELASGATVGVDGLTNVGWLIIDILPVETYETVYEDFYDSYGACHSVTKVVPLRNHKFLMGLPEEYALKTLREVALRERKKATEAEHTKHDLEVKVLKCEKELEEVRSENTKMKETYSGIEARYIDLKTRYDQLKDSK